MTDIHPRIHAQGWSSGLASFSLCVILLPIMRNIAERWRPCDLPAVLKIHSSPTPCIGGLARGCAFAAGISIEGTGLFSRALDLCFAFLLLGLVGLIDDLRNVSPLVRLMAQLAAGVLAADSQWRLSIWGNPIFDSVATCLFVMLFMNAFNFLDGADGLTARVAGLAGLGYVLVYSAQPASLGAAVAWSLLGSCAGFLLFTFPPAKVSMGDSASTVLGLVVAFLGLDSYRTHRPIGPHWLLPLAFAGWPLWDFSFAIIRPIRNRVSPFSGDCQHFYDLLHLRGWSPRPLAIATHLVPGALIVVGWLRGRSNRRWGPFILSLLVGCLLIEGVRLGSLR